MRDLYQRKPGGVYYCEFYGPDGRRARKSTRCKDRIAARLVRQRLEREAHDPRRAAAHAPAKTVHRILENFVNDGCLDVSDATLSMYLQKSGHLVRLIGELPITALQNISTMKGYIRSRTEEGAKPSTIHKELVTMRQALYAALEDKEITFDPRACFPRFRARYVPKERWLTPHEFLELLRAFRVWREGDDPLYQRQGALHRQMWIVVAVYTGGCDSEVDGMTWPGIDWKQKRVHLRGTKREARDRYVPLLPALEAVLSRSRQATGYVVGEWGNVRRDLHAACDRAGIPRCSPNDLRRTFATWMANLGVPENVLVQLMGHTSSRMIRKVYAKLQPELLAREMAKLTGACTTGVPANCPSETDMSVVSRESLAKVSEILMNPVLGPGIEPGTRGFSIRKPIKKHAGLRKRLAACTTGEPLRAVGGAA